MPCGICGFVGLSDRQLLSRMCEVIKHRGPDGTNYFLSDSVGLGINRLKIIDLVKGDQPIHNEDQTVWIVYNGEVYNYLELTRELEKAGHRFYTDSDTEAIVHAYEEWGEDCVSHLRGMFAFAIWDAKKRRMYLARDRFGKKPLFYTIVDGVFLFASEIKSILQYSGLRRSMNRDALDYFFTYMYIPSPLTIFEGIHSLPPANYAVYEGGAIRLRRYWDFAFRPDYSLDEDALADAVYAEIREAVKVRLRSDVPLGALLSGGIDSSAVVAVMSKLLETPVKTVSVGFEDGSSEVRYSRQVAEFLGTDHHEKIVSADAFKLLPTLIWHFDEPFADHSMIPTYYLSQATRKEVTVALSGDGGDEMFMGYSFLSDPQAYSLYVHTPRWVRRPVLKVLKELPFDRSFRRSANHAFEKDYDKQAGALRYAMRTSILSPAGLGELYSREALASHRPLDTYGYAASLFEASGAKDPLDAVDYATIRSYLADDILVKVDRMSMANSLEVRCPLLDQNLADLVGAVPSRMKLRGKVTKHIFKKMALKHGLLPRDIIFRRKRGFGAPVETWMKHQWKEVAGSLLDPIVTQDYMSYFDRGCVSRLLADPYLNSNRLFAILVFSLWYRMYIEEKKTTPPAIPAI